MKQIYTFSLILIFCLLGCIPKPTEEITEAGGPLWPPATTELKEIEGLEIERLMIDSLVGLPAYQNGDDISVGNLELESLSIELSEVDGSTFEKQITLKPLTYSMVEVTGKANTRYETRRPYRIGNLLFKEVILTRDGKEVKRLQNVKVSGWEANVWGMQSADNDEEEIQYLKLQIKDLEEQLERLLALIKEILDQEPDHAARLLTPVLEGYRADLQKIRNRYTYNQPSLETIEVDMAELNSIEFTFDEMEEELEDPENFPDPIENAVFFGTGDFEVIRPVHSQILDRDIETVVQRIEDLAKKHSDRKIVVQLSVTGYADDQQVDQPGTIQSLCDSVGQVNCPPDEGAQIFLNQVLSEQRAKNVARYIRETISGQMQVTESLTVKFEENYLGRGKTQYPAHLNRPCPGDCKERRVTVVSIIVYSEDSYR
jgi:hypothetical protein